MLALTILAQASSTATGHDMWEEREYTPEPPAAAPSAAVAGGGGAGPA